MCACCLISNVFAVVLCALQATAQLKGLVLLAAGLPCPWERVVQLDFGVRPGEAPSRKVFCEVMAK